MTQPIVIFGANGQVGSALSMLMGKGAICFTRKEADFTRPQSLPSLLQTIKPKAVINAAAYTAVDKAEEEEALADVINGEAPGVLAKFCAEQQIPFIHYSTDYVFSGTGKSPWKETDTLSPLNAYGRSKLLGEQKIQAAGGNYLIFRISWVYDAYGKNFVNTMLRLGKERDTLSVVGDQFGAPCYAPHIADMTAKILRTAMDKEPFPSGVYHLCAGGLTSWYRFALEIFARAREHEIPLTVETLREINTKDYPTPAKRPLNSRLDCHKLYEIFGLAMPTWERGLDDCFKELAKKEMAI